MDLLETSSFQLPKFRWVKVSNAIWGPFIEGPNAMLLCGCVVVCDAIAVTCQSNQLQFACTVNLAVMKLS